MFSTGTIYRRQHYWDNSNVLNPKLFITKISFGTLYPLTKKTLSAKISSAVSPLQSLCTPSTHRPNLYTLVWAWTTRSPGPSSQNLRAPANGLLVSCTRRTNQRISYRCTYFYYGTSCKLTLPACWFISIFRSPALLWRLNILRTEVTLEGGVLVVKVLAQVLHELFRVANIGT